MEMRNKDLENAWAVQGIRQEKCAKLEEENKKLKEQLERMKTDTMYDMKDINSLYKENGKLKEDVEYRHHRCMVAERQLRGEDED